MNEQIIAVDFDGTLCENKWPEIGEPNTNLIGYLIEMRKSFGAKIILWTCRVGEMLDKAVNWCSEHRLEFDAVNENLPHIVERFGSDTRKIFANVYIDDRITTRNEQSCSTMRFWPIFIRAGGTISLMSGIHSATGLKSCRTVRLLRVMRRRKTNNEESSDIFSRRTVRVNSRQSCC